MTRIVWLTDPHLNHVTQDQTVAFLERVASQSPEAVLIGGDFSESRDVMRLLELVDEALAAPVYFVLGHNDYYFSSIAAIRGQVAALCKERPKLHYLSQLGVCELSANVGLVGHDGWADAQYGDYERSLVMMYDYTLIEELAAVGKKARLPILRKLGNEAAAHIRVCLPQALKKYPQVYLLTHVPPLRDACWHQGQISNDEWAPHFTCKAMGDAILEIMRDYPNRQLTVLCGHTHGAGQCRPLPNVQIITGAAEYGNPEITGVFEVE